MRRSRINAIMRDAHVFIQAHGFHLPPFAYWTPEEWSTRGEEVQEIVDRSLGWDVTDFGLGDYESFGLFLFTLRNGTRAALRKSKGKLYAEKIMVVDVDQITPLHFHWSKTEDIINRGGGKLAIQLYKADESDELSDSDISITMDGVTYHLQSGETVVLHPGQSITVPTRIYHEFWGVESRVLVGEVSVVNDDTRDNRFYKPVGRFPEIEEDESPLYLLVSDYSRYYRPRGRA